MDANTKESGQSTKKEGGPKGRFTSAVTGRPHPAWSVSRALDTLARAYRAFSKDACLLRAASLTFYTVMSVVPVFAVMFSFAKGLGFRSILERQLRDNLYGQEEVLTYIISFSERLLENVKGGVLAGVGVLVLLWTVLMMLGNMEESFNHIWNVKRPRSLARKFSDYLSVMLVGPVLLASSSSIAILAITRLGDIGGREGVGGIVGPLAALSLKAVPLVLMWALFTFIYVFIPNRKVPLKPAIVSGLAASISFIALQRVYLGFQIGVSHYNAIYGSFAAVPLFLTFTQLGWIIVLFGAELCHAMHDAGGFASLGPLDPFDANVAALAVVHRVVTNYSNRGDSTTKDEMKKTAMIPGEVLEEILVRLEASGILLGVSCDEPSGRRYVPGRDPCCITACHVIEAVCGLLPQTTPHASSRLRDTAPASILLGLARDLEHSEAARPLKDLDIEGVSRTANQAAEPEPGDPGGGSAG